jgi:hypothetical protein
VLLVNLITRCGLVDYSKQKFYKIVPWQDKEDGCVNPLVSNEEKSIVQTNDGELCSVDVTAPTNNSAHRRTFTIILAELCSKIVHFYVKSSMSILIKRSSGENKSIFKNNSFILVVS